MRLVVCEKVKDTFRIKVWIRLRTGGKAGFKVRVGATNMIRCKVGLVGAADSFGAVVR